MQHVLRMKSNRLQKFMKLEYPRQKIIRFVRLYIYPNSLLKVNPKYRMCSFISNLTVCSISFTILSRNILLVTTSVAIIPLCAETSFVIWTLFFVLSFFFESLRTKLSKCELICLFSGQFCHMRI